KPPRSLQPVPRCLCCCLLRRRVIKDGGPVTGPDVRPLAVYLRGIVYPPEDIEELIVRDDFWVKENPHCLCVACFSGTDLLVCRVGDSPPGITCLRCNNPLDLPERGFDSPE